jgi:hypothetical protein
VEWFREHGNEPSGSIKFWGILGWLHNWRLLNEGSSPWSYFEQKEWFRNLNERQYDVFTRTRASLKFYESDCMNVNLNGLLEGLKGRLCFETLTLAFR